MRFSHFCCSFSLAMRLLVPRAMMGSPKSRAFSMASFVCKHLFRAGANSSRWGKTTEPASKGFPDAFMHLNHLVKLHDFKSVDKESLLLRMSRGAAVLCANNHTGIDTINVFLCSGTRLSIDNFGLVLGQIKLDSDYTDTPKQELFTAMNPYKCNILKPEDSPVPIVRIVFALAAETACLKVVRNKPTAAYNAITYDIWCAGISSEVLTPIDSPYAHVWDALLQASYSWRELYKADTEVERNLRRSMNPGAASDEGHWSRWAVRSKSMLATCLRYPLFVH